jgi:NADPH:quinone reductase-like Zn-dependent oxidoreductase
MKALTYNQYGAPEKVLAFREVPVPAPSEHEVLIRIHSTTVNDYDWSLVRGKPYLYRLMFGLFKPKKQIPGMEFAGTIVSVGTEVKGYQEGDEVFGDISTYGFGSFAQYLAINEKAVVRKPDYMRFEEAAALPHASLLALQSIRKMGPLRQGMKVLINGGGGGVGTIGLQLFKRYGCHVTGVDSGDKLSMMRSLGFDEVIDYRKTNFTKNGIAYDIILDCKTVFSIFNLRRSLSSKGIYVTIGGHLGKILMMLFWRHFLSIRSSKQFHLLSLIPNDGLEDICAQFKKGYFKPQIDGPYPFDEAPRLIQYFGEGKHLGKIVINLI